MEASNAHTLTHIGNLFYDILHPAIIFRMAMRSDIGGMFFIRPTMSVGLSNKRGAQTTLT